MVTKLAPGAALRKRKDKSPGTEIIPDLMGVTAAFETRTAADAARAALIAAGNPSNEIQLFDCAELPPRHIFVKLNNTCPVPAAHLHYCAEAISRGYPLLVALVVPAQHAAAVAAVNAQHPIDLRAKMDKWRTDGRSKFFYSKSGEPKSLDDIAETLEEYEETDYDTLPYTKGFVLKSPPTSIANAHTQFFTAVGIRDERLRDLVADVVRAAIEGDEIRLGRVREALNVRQIPAVPPAKAPELYRDRPLDPETGKRENIEQFLTRAYKAELDAGVLTAPALSRLDIAAYNAYRDSRARFPNLNLPSKSELMAREKADPALMREAQRLAKRSYRERVSGIKRGPPQRGE